MILQLGRSKLKFRGPWNSVSARSGLLYVPALQHLKNLKFMFLGKLNRYIKWNVGLNVFLKFQDIEK